MNQVAQFVPHNRVCVARCVRGYGQTAPKCLVLVRSTSTEETGETGGESDRIVEASQSRKLEEAPKPGSRAGSSSVDFDELAIVGSALGFSFLGAIAIVFLPSVIEQADQTYYFDTSLSPGDCAGALLWSFSYFFVSPLQLLLLFLGRIETTRPSDAIVKLGGQLLGQDTEALGYEPPVGLQVAAVLACLTQGVITSLLFELALGEETWSVSTGIGSLFAAFVYEVGRPKRLSKQDEIELEAVWRDFESFADTALLKSGRCHVRFRLVVRSLCFVSIHAGPSLTFHCFLAGVGRVPRVQAQVWQVPDGGQAE